MNANTDSLNAHAFEWPTTTGLGQAKRKRLYSPLFPQAPASKRHRRSGPHFNCEVQYGPQPVLMTLPTPSPLRLSPSVASSYEAVINEASSVPLIDSKVWAPQRSSAASWTLPPLSATSWKQPTLSAIGWTEHPPIMKPNGALQNASTQT
jgi:hypothetical protein